MNRDGRTIGTAPNSKSAFGAIDQVALHPRPPDNRPLLSGRVINSKPHGDVRRTAGNGREKRIAEVRVSLWVGVQLAPPVTLLLLIDVRIPGCT